MKTNVKILGFTIALAMLQFITSCSDGEDGAIGPPGPQGEQGIPGRDGMDGMDGQDFTANDIESTVDIINPILNEVLGSSTLVRSNGNLNVKFETSGLAPGYAYTLWWVVWNHPENCDVPGECADTDFPNATEVEVEVLFGIGGVADINGNAVFNADLAENDDSRSINASIFGLPEFGGLHDAMIAEVHPILRSHGPAIPGMIADQISFYEGGCTNNFPPFTEIPDEEGECGDIAFALHRL